MKSLRQKMLAMAVVVTVSGLMMASVVGAAPKLIVKDNATPTPNDVFTVDEAGVIVGKKLAMGTSTPQAPLHLHTLTALGATTLPGTKLYNVSTGFAGSTQDNTFQIDLIAADGTGAAGMVGAIRGVRARGSLENPAVPSLDDNVLSLMGGLWDGGKVYNSAQIVFKVDGTVSSNVAPQRISYFLRNGGTGPWLERMTIKNNGNIGIGAPDPKSKLHVVGLVTYTSNAEALANGLTAGAFYTDGAGNVKVVY